MKKVGNYLNCSECLSGRKVIKWQKNQWLLENNVANTQLESATVARSVVVHAATFADLDCVEFVFVSWLLKVRFPAL
jgi:hypothetical protein